MKDIIRSVLENNLANQTYQGDLVQQQTKSIADAVKEKLKDLALPRYKYMVQVVIGEQRGEGIRMGCRTFWASTDTYASDTFVNDSLFCCCVAYAVYLC